MKSAWGLCRGRRARTGSRLPPALQHGRQEQEAQGAGRRGGAGRRVCLESQGRRGRPRRRGPDQEACGPAARRRRSPGAPRQARYERPAARAPAQTPAPQPREVGLSCPGLPSPDGRCAPHSLPPRAEQKRHQAAPTPAPGPLPSPRCSPQGQPRVALPCVSGSRGPRKDSVPLTRRGWACQSAQGPAIWTAATRVGGPCGLGNNLQMAGSRCPQARPELVSHDGQSHAVLSRLACWLFY